MGPKRLFPVLAAAFAAAVVIVLALRSGDEGDRTGARPDSASAPAPERPAAEPLAAANVHEAEESAPAATPRVALETRPETTPEAAPAEHRGPALRGRLVDAANGLPLVGVEVTGHAAVSDLSRMTRHDPVREEHAESGADGTFELLGLEPGQVDLSFRLAGYAPLDRHGLRLPEVEVHDLGQLELAQGAILLGRVVDGTGTGVEGAKLTLSGTDGFMVFGGARGEPLAVTEADGSFRVEYLACGPWGLLVTHEQHPAGLFRGEANEPGRTVGGLLFRLRPAASISGRVVDVAPADLADLRVRAMPAGGLDFLDAGGDPSERDRMIEELASGRRDVELDAGGAFEVQGLTAGNKYRLEAYKGQRGVFAFGGATPAGSVLATAGDRGVELRYDPLGTLSFQVVDAATRQPLTEFVVRTGGRFARNPHTGPDGKTLKHHPNGVVCLDGLPTGDRKTSVFVEATGYASWELEALELAPGEVRDLGVVALDPMSLVRVHVLEEKSGESVAGARVSLSRQREGEEGNFEISIELGPDDDTPVFGGEGVRRAVTDDEGWAVLNSFEGELATLRVESRTHAPYELRDWALPRGESVEHEARLRVGGRVLVSVLDPSGVPMPGVRVQHRPPGAGGPMILDTAFLPGRGAVETDGEGVATFDHLAPGTHGFKLGTGQTPGVFELDGGAGAFVSADVRIAGDVGAPAVDPWSEVAVVDGETHELELWADALGGLSGRVREAGLPLAGAVLSLRKKQDEAAGPAGMGIAGLMSGPRAKTDGDGQYAFDEVEAGDYELSVSHPSRALPARFDVEVEEGGSLFDVELSVSILAGRITDTKGRPLPGVKVQAERAPDPSQPVVRMASIMVLDDSSGGGAISMSSGDKPEPTITDADGRYELRGVPTDVALVVRASGSTVQTGTSEPVTVAPGEHRDDLDMALQPAGLLEVLVLDAKGDPVRFCMVSAEPVDLEDAELEVDPRETPRSMTDPEGLASLDGMAPGRWRIEAQSFGDGGGEAQPVTVEVEAGENERVTLTIP